MPTPITLLSLAGLPLLGSLDGSQLIFQQLQFLASCATIDMNMQTSVISMKMQISDINRYHGLQSLVVKQNHVGLFFHRSGSIELQWFYCMVKTTLVNVSVYMHVCFIFHDDIMFYLLQVKLDKFWQMPFHLFGSGLNPSSLKLCDSGQIPVSSILMITSPLKGVLGTYLGKPMKSHDLVVWSFFFSLGNADIIPSMPKIQNFVEVHVYDSMITKTWNGW